MMNYTKSYRIYYWVWQGCRIQDQYSKINCIAIYKLQLKTEIKIPFALASKYDQPGQQSETPFPSSKKKTFLGMNLKRDIKDLYTENFKTILLEGMKEELNNWNDALCSWFEWLIIKMPILPKLICKFNTT